MKYGLRDEHLRTISHSIRSNTKVRRAVLFGSRAKGTHTAGSDIDICIETDGLALRELDAIRVKLDDLMLPYKLDIIDSKSISNPDLIDHIARVGKEI